MLTDYNKRRPYVVNEPHPKKTLSPMGVNVDNSVTEVNEGELFGVCMVSILSFRGIKVR